MPPDWPESNRPPQESEFQNAFSEIPPAWSCRCRSDRSTQLETACRCSASVRSYQTRAPDKHRNQSREVTSCPPPEQSHRGIANETVGLHLGKTEFSQLLVDPNFDKLEGPCSF